MVIDYSGRIDARGRRQGAPRAHETPVAPFSPGFSPYLGRILGWAESTLEPLDSPV